MVIAGHARALQFATGPIQVQVMQRLDVDRAPAGALEVGQSDPTPVSLWDSAQALQTAVGDRVAEPRGDCSQILQDRQQGSRRSRAVMTGRRLHRLPISWPTKEC